jgi:hypothetical protein
MKGDSRPPPSTHSLNKRSVGVFLVFLSYLCLSQYDHHTINRGGIDELDGMFTKAIYNMVLMILRGEFSILEIVF